MNNRYDSDDNFQELDEDIREQEQEPETFEVRMASNDNGSPKRKKTAFGPSPYKRERVDLLLATAGFDPAKIPIAHRVTALWVVGCFDKKIYDEGLIVECLQRPLTYVRKVIDFLRAAAKPGTLVG